MDTKEKKCFICEEPAGKSERNIIGILCCQGCHNPICDDCVVCGYDGLPRCEECHKEHREYCEEECQGKFRKVHHCECDYC